MAKKTIFLEDIRTGGDKHGVVILFGLFALSGIGISMGTLVAVLRDASTNNIISFIVATFLFGIPFGYFLGIKKIAFRLNRNAMIKNGNVFFYIDEIVDKTHLTNTTDFNDPKEYQLTTKTYSTITKKNVFLPAKNEYISAKVGSNCILCFTPMSNYPFRVFPCSLYELSDELQKKCVSSLEQKLK